MFPIHGYVHEYDTGASTYRSLKPELDYLEVDVQNLMVDIQNSQFSWKIYKTTYFILVICISTLIRLL